MMAKLTEFDKQCIEKIPPQEMLERELCQKYLDEHKPKLDLTDFARV